MSARYIGYLLITAISGVMLYGWIQYQHPEGGELVELGPDLVEIARSEVFGSLDRPAVAFQHEQHVEKLEGEDCTVCHEKDAEGALVPSFARDLDDAGDLMDAFHDQCIGCHRERVKEGDSAGPRSCGGCHVHDKRYASSRKPMGFHLELHHKHVTAHEDKCETCHHSWDEQARELVYVEGTESSCRDCHGEVTADKLLSMRDTAHDSCVGCHRDLEKEGKEGGPTKCSGCHEEGEIDPLTPQEHVPRLERDQPDQTTIELAFAPFLDVEFDHQNHEGLVSSCHTCHHQRLDKCATCHTHEGDELADGIRLQDAYHLHSSNHSCVGSHNTQNERDKQCAGCHGDGQLAIGGTDGSCNICHVGEQLADLPAVLAAELSEAQLAALQAFVNEQLGTPTDSDDPADTDEVPLMEDGPKWPPPAPPPGDLEEEYEIGELADKYQPTVFKHKEHIENLMEAAQENPLADAFHSDSAFTCIACHHSATVSAEEKNQKCTDCHGEPSNPEDPDALVGAAAAYHRQCVGCHLRMEVVTEEEERPLECTDCHAEANGAEEAKQ